MGKNSLGGHGSLLSKEEICRSGLTWIQERSVPTLSPELPLHPCHKSPPSG